MNKSKRAVDWINDPAAAGAALVFAFLLAEYAVVGKTFCDLAAQVAFGLAIRDGDVTAVGLRARLRPLAKVLQRDVPGATGKRDGEFEQFAEFVLICVHSAALSGLLVYCTDPGAACLHLPLANLSPRLRRFHLSFTRSF